MIKHGARPNKVSHKDFDYLKSHHPQLYTGTAAPPTFPDEYTTDVGLFGFPDQNKEGEPYGCTNYAQAELSTDLTKVEHNPLDLEAVTHANARGGLDIRTSLDAARKTLKWFTGYYNIVGSGIIDAFSAFQLAQGSAAPAEKRTITLGTPWFPSWESAIEGTISTREPDGNYSLTLGTPKAVLLPMPTQEELANIRRNQNAYPWHNSVLTGWDSKLNGVLTYRDKSWQGANIGEGGLVRFDRATINTVMALKGTVAFTATNMTPTSIQRIDINVVDWIVSLVRNLLHLS